MLKLRRGSSGEEPYARFTELVQYARARGLVAIVESIITDKDWRAKAWYLERTHPEDFAPVAQRVIGPSNGVKPWNGKGLQPYDPSASAIVTMITKDDESDKKEAPPPDDKV